MKNNVWKSSALALLLTFSVSSIAMADDGDQKIDPKKRFGTINIPPQSREHEKVTRAAVSCKSGTQDSDYSCLRPGGVDQFAGKLATFGAVGNPDNPISGWTSVTKAHCDDMDYLNSYKDPAAKERSRTALKECVEYMWKNFDTAIQKAQELADKNGNINESEMEYPVLGCTYAGNFEGDAKCNVFQALGAAAHAYQDFYSHSNWSDGNGSGSVTDPPGLQKTTVPDFLRFDTGDRTQITVPDEFSGGCFALAEKLPVPDKWFNKCVKEGRVTHATMNKDNGTIDPATGETKNPKTSRGKKNNNFENAVKLAVENTRINWKAFISEVQVEYPGKQGVAIACAMSHDKHEKCANLT